MNQVIREADLSEREADEFFESEPFRLALARYINARAEKGLNAKAGAIYQIIQEVDVSARPFTDEHGHYVAYSCRLCGTRAKVRAQKRGQGKKAQPMAGQLPIPGEEV